MKAESFKGVALLVLMVAAIIVPALSISFTSPASALLDDLTPHAPIYIDGNDNFTPANGVVGGIGTEDDPYIIENWDISAENANGVEIRNTTAHFIIRKCYVHDGRSYANLGVHLYTVVNGKIDNNTVENNYYGILLTSSSNNILTNNACFNNSRGIYLDYYSDNNIILNNIVGNNRGGIEIFLDSDNNLISNNIVENSSTGILDNASDNNIISNNTVLNNGYGIILVNGGDNNLILNNTVGANEYGIYLAHSDNNLVSNNIVENNIFKGIDPGSGNNFISNNIVGNNFYGIHLYSSDNKTLDNNIMRNNDYGIYLYLSNNNLVSNNTVENSRRYGICLDHSDNNLISNNRVENTRYFGIYYYGICFGYGSDSNFIYHNNFINNAQQAYDSSTNFWDDGYPSGGNYWSDYIGADNYGGENQGMPGRDRIGDTSYYISGDNNFDRYPIMSPFPLSWTGWARFSLLPIRIPGWPPQYIHDVLLEMNLALYQGSKLVVKFYTYDNTYEDENVIHENFAPPWHIEENEIVGRPRWLPCGVKKAKLWLVDSENNEISKIKGWVTIRDDLWRVLMEIRARWPYWTLSERDAAWRDFSCIRTQWPYAPSTRDPVWIED